MKRTLFDLTGRSALVTGGSKGIGKAIAGIFAQAGAEVMLAARHEDELRAAAEEIRRASGARVEYAVADMTRRSDVRRLADHAVATLGKVDILVNNAGANLPQAIDSIRDEDWDRLVELNLTSCMALSRAHRAGHEASAAGAASSTSRRSWASAAPPAATPIRPPSRPCIGLARAMALDLGPYNITVNCIAPGPIATDMPMSILSKDQQAVLAARTAFNRWAKPDELAGPALLLASEAGSFVTGTVLVVDGGAMARVF